MLCTILYSPLSFNILDPPLSRPRRRVDASSPGAHLGARSVSRSHWFSMVVSYCVSTVAMRATLLPLLVFQLTKLKKIEELFPKLPSPMQPMLSGKSYIDRFSLFRKERKAIGCPSFLWFFAFSPVQQLSLKIPAVSAKLGLPDDDAPKEAANSLGKFTEGIVHLERIAQLKEPDEPKSKARYFDGLLMLASASSNVGRKDEALKHLRLAAAYNEFLEQCEKEEDGLVSDLASSRRADY